MAINRPSLSSVSITDVVNVTVEVRYGAPPSSNEYIDPAEPRGRLVGYYDPVSDTVRLFVADTNGRRWLAV